MAIALLWECGTDGLEAIATTGGEAAYVAYFADSPGLESSLRECLAGLSARIEPVAVPDVDWVARFRAGFTAFAAGSFWITPTWEAGRRAPDEHRLLVVDPGRAFGTGTHETTRLCLRAIQAISPPATHGARVIDLGTGTGILAVAAALLGWRRPVGVDLDPAAIDSARTHAALNGVAVSLVRGDGGAALAPRAFDLVLANLTAPLLLERRDEIGRLAAPGATLVLAGLLASDLDSLVTRYAPLGAVATDVLGEWASLAIRVPR
jgi:ribosomal protein L11 methyltransferase